MAESRPGSGARNALVLCASADAADRRWKGHPGSRSESTGLARLETEKQLEVISGTGHVFEELGASEEVARLARERFERHLRS
jgi:hypothetical protein